MSRRIEVLQQLFAEAEARVKEKPTRDNIAAFSEAAKALDEALGGENPGGFETQEAAVLYLTEKGWKVGKSKFSADFTANLVMKRGGLFRPDDLDAYAELNLQLLDNSEAAAGQISEKELLAKEQRRRLTIANDQAEGRLTPTEQIERMLAGRAALLKADMNRFWEDHSRAIVRLVGGDETKVADLIEYGQEQTAEHFNRYGEEQTG